MLEHIHVLKQALIAEFFELYDRYQEHEIYACSLVFDEFLLIDYLAVSTELSIFNDQEDQRQYLSEKDRWNVSKWRYRVEPNQDRGLLKFKAILTDYYQSQHSFGNPLLENKKFDLKNNVGLMLTTFKQVKDDLEQEYGLDLSKMVFFLSAPNHANIEVHSIQYLNPNHALLPQFLDLKQPKERLSPLKSMKLSQSDKDILTDLAQIAELEPYDYLEVAQQAYLLTLEPYFIDTNIYIQKLIQNIAAMTADTAGQCAMDKEEILNRINQFYPKLLSNT